MSCFQMYSRNNDSSGNPYRLLLVYSVGDDGEEPGTVIEAHEARSSSPNVERVLRRKCTFQLPTMHLAPRDYNDLKHALAVRIQWLDEVGR